MCKLWLMANETLNQYVDREQSFTGAGKCTTLAYLRVALHPLAFAFCFPTLIAGYGGSQTVSATSKCVY